MRSIVGGFASLIIVFLMFTGSYAGESVFYYHTDPAGTPLAMTDVNGVVVWRVDYKPFGEEQSINPQTKENDMRFVGKEKDKETGLQYFGARYMKDEIGRFISPDPIGPVDPRTSKTNYKLLLNPQRLNRYSYALNNPYRYVDPDGAFSVEVHRRMTIQVFTSSGFSQRAAERVAQGNVYVDRPSNQLANYQHSMSDIGQRRDEAIAAAYNFSRERLLEAGRLIASGDYERGLFVLGEGLHTVQDRKHN